MFNPVKTCKVLTIFGNLKSTHFFKFFFLFFLSWYHGSLTREQAEFLLKDALEGSYIMRESTHYPGDYTLCLKSEVKVENYHIKQSNNRFTIDEENMFNNLIELVDFYTKFDDLACKLKCPVIYKIKEESSDYQTLLDNLWIDNKDIKMGREIGIGEFGGENFY